MKFDENISDVPYWWNESPPKDIIAQAQSGTGKTGLFVTGILQIIDTDIKECQALILAPTHELAHQIQNVTNSIGKFLNIKTQLLVGGTSVENDKNQLLKKTPHVVVGTPGRVHDMLRRRYLTASTLKILVIDEADEMLSAGFKDQMYKIFQ